MIGIEPRLAQRRQADSLACVTKIEAPPPGFRLLHILPGTDVWFGRLKWSSRGRRLAAGASDKTIWVWDLQSGRFLRKIKSGPSSVVAFAWMGDSNILTWTSDQLGLQSQSVLGGWSHEVRLDGLKGALLSVDCSPDAQTIVALTADQRVRLWERRTGKLIREIEEPWQAEEVVWTFGGRRLTLRDSRGSCWQRDVESGDQLAVFNVRPNSIEHAFAWSPDERLFAAGIGEAILIKSPEGDRLSPHFSSPGRFWLSGGELPMRRGRQGEKPDSVGEMRAAADGNRAQVG
ncbi:MAG TPA: hypothetical protein VHQ90_21855, partial [Thermoanaerobaculia bacterium]|nr:hypothetical protein [Thermoanaerobaculia bacterium]